MLNHEASGLVSSLPGVMKELGIYPRPTVVTGPTTNPVVEINGRKVVQFATGNYLGLAMNGEALDSLVEGARSYGLTSSGSRHVCGSQEPQLDLEAEIARFQNEQDALLFFLVTVANDGVVTAMLDNPWLGLYSKFGITQPKGQKEAFFDWHSHPSVTRACRVAVGKEGIRPYKHLDMNDLERKLRSSKATLKLIATDGLFSADGDMAPLPDIVSLAERYGAMVLVDDAHGVGVLGANGRGVWEHFGVSERVDFKIGSLAKAFSGGLGGFVACGSEMGEYLRITASHYIFGGSIPPAIASAIISNMRTAAAQPWRRRTVLENASYLREILRSRGYMILGDNSPIVPIVVGGSEDSLRVSAELLDRGYYAPPFRFPAVPENQARIRATLMATHTKEQIDGFAEAFITVMSKVGVAA